MFGLGFLVSLYWSLVGDFLIIFIGCRNFVKIGVDFLGFLVVKCNWNEKWRGWFFDKMWWWLGGGWNENGIILIKWV